jgi:predicted aldo/keto reductase-like oxidoreductase
MWPFSRRSAMAYRPLGRTSLRVSAVGFGTCQLRQVPEQQAIDTLKRGFELGVNVVHTAPDYGGADDLVAQAIEESGRDVLVFAQGYGALSHFEWLFETACRRYKTRRLDIFGIAGIEDREFLKEPVWGKGGMVEFLLEKKRQGRLGAIYAETHGTPEYIGKLITAGVFDAIVLAYNSLGFHVLSYFPEPASGVIAETIPRNRTEIFPLARQHGVALMVMKPLAGGLLTPGKAFPPHMRFSAEREPLKAGEILRALLMEPDITCVVPGTASPEEAEENARAGHRPAPLPPERLQVLEHSTGEMLTTLCRRCGQCDTLCSKGLPVSWLFRDAYIANTRSETFETLDRLQYFHLHPHEAAACASCEHVTCRCPYDIDIPGSLLRVHDQMLALRDAGLLPETPAQIARQAPRGAWAVKIISREIPSAMGIGEKAIVRLWLENSGSRNWPPSLRRPGENGLVLVTRLGGQRQETRLRHEVEPGTRTHFSLEVTAPARAGRYELEFFLASPESGDLGETDAILRSPIEVT